MHGRSCMNGTSRCPMHAWHMPSHARHRDCHETVCRCACSATMDTKASVVAPRARASDHDGSHETRVSRHACNLKNLAPVLSVHAGTGSAREAKVSRASCEVNSAASSNIQSRDGFAEACAPPEPKPRYKRCNCKISSLFMRYIVMLSSGLGHAQACNPPRSGADGPDLKGCFLATIKNSNPICRVPFAGTGNMSTCGNCKCPDSCIVPRFV